MEDSFWQKKVKRFIVETKEPFGYFLSDMEPVSYARDMDRGQKKKEDQHEKGSWMDDGSTFSGR